MADQSQIEILLARLDQLLQRQDVFAKEISELKAEIYHIKNSSAEPEPLRDLPVHPEPMPTREISAIDTPLKTSSVIPKKRSDIEKFIGENLINKIGIIITVLGVSIGVKYSVENDLISPLGRVLLGYFAGLALLGFGLKFRKKYENYSAVLVSGAIAVLYFITYAAYSFYGIFPQIAAFILMLVFTGLTVFTALKYNRQVIAHIGMVGAYAIPFLLGDDSGRVWILFSYMVIINLGILVIALKRYWKNLFYAVFLITWLIFSVWLFDDYVSSSHFTLAILFASIFFCIFYITFLGYKLIHMEKYNLGDVGLLLANSFIFYGLGYYIISETQTWENYSGVFTVFTAIIHAVVAFILKRKAIQDLDLYYFITGLSIVFLTISVPVQLDAGWVTLLWAGEAALLFYIGRTRQAPAYERIAYIVIAFAFISLLDDWQNHYYLSNHEAGNYISPLWNTGFLTSFLFLNAIGFITYQDRKKPGHAFPLSLGMLNSMVKYALPAVFLFSLYYAFRIEIETYWQQRFLDSAVNRESTDGLDFLQYNNFDLIAFKSVWVINYTIAFLFLLSLINLMKIKSRKLGIVTLSLSVITLMVFLTQGLIALGELRRSHSGEIMSEYYSTGSFHLWIRYISIFFVGLLLMISYRSLRKGLIGKSLKIPFDLFMHFTILMIASSELFIWTNFNDSGTSHKLGLSILWGTYSLLLIGLGINLHKKHLRIAAMVLFGITLVKLFVYDIADLNTISKTIVFVCLGVLLLVISFLYNKYKNRISGV